MHWLWCIPDPAQAPTLGAEAENNLFALPQQSTSFNFKFLNHSLSEYFFQKDLKAWLWDTTKQKAIFSLSMSSGGQWPYLKNFVLFTASPLQLPSWPLIYIVIMSENSLNKTILLFLKRSTVNKTTNTIFTSCSVFKRIIIYSRSTGIVNIGEDSENKNKICLRAGESVLHWKTSEIQSI